MKNILKYLGVVGLAAGMFAACEHPDISEIFDGDAMSQKGYIAYMYAPSTTAYEWTYHASSSGYELSPALSDDELPLLTSLRLSRPAEQAVTVKLAYDMEALDALNAQLIEQNGEAAKQYTLFESSKLNNMSYTFAKGESELPLSLLLDRDELTANEESHYFAVPLRIESVSGDNLIANACSFLLTFDVKYVANNIKFSPSSSSYALELLESGEPRNDLQQAQLGLLSTDFAVSETTTIKLRINNDRIASSGYSSDSPVPNVTLEKDTFVLEPGGRMTESVKLLFPNGLQGLVSGKNYQVPVEIESVNGSGVVIGTPSVYTYRITTSTYYVKYVSFSQTEHVYTIQYPYGSDEKKNTTNRISTECNAVLTHAVSAASYAYLKIDDSLVEKYNQEHQTSYEVAPIKALRYQYFFISNGSSTGYSTYKVQVDISDNMSSLVKGHNYLIPVTFDTTRFSGDSAMAESPTNNVFYIKVESEELQGVSIKPATGPTGAEIPRDNIKANSINPDTPNTMGADVTADVKGQGTANYLTFSKTSGLFIDLGAEYPLTGICFNGYRQFSSTGAYMPHTIGVEISTDNQTWTNLGDSDPLTQSLTVYAKFEQVRNVRYMRLYMRGAFQGNGSGATAYIDSKVGIYFYQQ